MQRVVIEQSVETAVRPSARVCETAAMFGLGVDGTRRLAIVKRCEVPLPRGGVVFVTGPSGGGKTTILKLIGEQCRRVSLHVIDFATLPAPADAPLVDCFSRPGLELRDVLSLLALVGLGDAFVMLRTPGQLSDGQRHRLRLAQAIDRAEQESTAGGASIMFADEFCATLDRQTAKNIAAGVGRWVRKTAHTFVCATTHDELLESLEPEVLIYKGLGEEMEVVAR